MSYEELKKLDRKSLKKLRDGQGPCDECICHILSCPPDPLTFGKIYRKIMCYLRRFRKQPPPEKVEIKGSKRRGKKRASPKSSRSSYKSKRGKRSKDRRPAPVTKKGSRLCARRSKDKGIEVKSKKGDCCRNC